MMPLIMADTGVVCGIKRIGGEGAQRQFIEGLGFVPGAEVVIISKNADNLIVSIKGSRVAINKDIALKIMV
ncbi:MAG: FeoA family protein [bacterium]|nr:FeoA family protein [bacterium]